jgi:hypothetical protein
VDFWFPLARKKPETRFSAPEAGLSGKKSKSNGSIDAAKPRELGRKLCGLVRRIFWPNAGTVFLFGVVLSG